MDINYIKENKLLIAGLSAFVGICSLGTYAKVWEYRQTEERINNAIIRDIKEYDFKNDLHWSYRGNRIYIIGEERPIDFPIDRWDSTVKNGDSVELIVRRSFPLFGEEFDGRQINDHK